MTDVIKELQAYLDGDNSVVMSKRLVRETIAELEYWKKDSEALRMLEHVTMERDALRKELIEASEMLLNQARTIKAYQDAALNKGGSDGED